MLRYLMQGLNVEVPDTCKGLMLRYLMQGLDVEVPDARA
jgi:hypothetical protein